ncbi:MAG: T9SS type A sorting domain-containing protein [Chitinophagales bacterium]|nr:T9SS type A sorting domain-containing protein [Chitinophagales bacterium]
MNPYKFLLLTALLLSGALARSQSLSPTVVASNGKQLTGPGIQLSYTVGEVAVTTKIAGASTLTQGFHQSYKNAVGIAMVETPVSITVFPNPATNYVQVKMEGSLAQSIIIRLYSLSGQLVKEESSFTPGLTTVDVTELTAGVYLLQVADHNGNLKGIYRIEKIS